MQCNAIKEKDMIGKHLSNHNKQGSQEKWFEAYFSLKCFLQKVWLTWLGRLSINLEQKEVSYGLYLLNSKHKQST